VDVAGRRLFAGHAPAQRQCGLLRIRAIGILNGPGDRRTRAQAEHLDEFLIPLDDANLPDLAPARSEIVNAQRDSRQGVEEAALLEHALTLEDGVLGLRA